MKTTTPALSERLAIGPAGLTRYNPGSGHTYAVTGLHAYEGNSFIHLTTDPAPMPNTYAPDPFDTSRPRWQTRLLAVAFGLALCGLLGSLAWFGYIAFTL